MKGHKPTEFQVAKVLYSRGFSLSQTTVGRPLHPQGWWMAMGALPVRSKVIGASDTRHLVPFRKFTRCLQTAMPRILPRLIKALQRPPGPFEDEIRIAPGLRSKTRRKLHPVPPHKQRIPIRVSRPAAQYSKSLLLDEENQVKRRKGPPPVVKYQGQDGARLMNEDELRWWSNPYRAYVSQTSATI